MAKPSLTYFNIRGLAEPIRVILADAQVEYNDVAFNLPVDGKPDQRLVDLKASGKLDFDQVPLYEESDGFRIAQSGSIIRYLARKHGLNGKNEHEAAKIDSFYEYYKDITTGVSTTSRTPDSVKRDELKKKLIDEDLPKHLHRLDTHLHNNKTGFFVGASASYADLLIWYMLDNYSDQGLLDVSKYENLSKFKKAIESRPGMQKYISNPHRYPVSHAFPRYVMYSYEGNPNVKKSLIAAQYGGIKIEHGKFVMGTDNKTPEFLKKNPNGQVPLLDSPDGPIYESNAIARYVARKGTDKGLLGSNEFESSLVDQWIEWYRSRAEKDIYAWFLPAVGYGTFDQKKHDDAKAAINIAFGILNGHLEGKEWLVGKRVTLADIVLFASMHLAFTLVTDPTYMKPYANIVAWANRCASQPQFKAVIPEFKFAEVEKKAPSS